jgi:predicted porin
VHAIIVRDSGTFFWEEDKMKRKALAVAVGALFAAPAAQAQITFGNEQIGTMQIYGKLYPQFGWFSSTGATQPGSSVSTLSGSGLTPATITTLGGTGVIEEPPPRQLLDVQNSYIGFRGERGFGAVFGGLKAIWQLEQATNFDTGTGTFGSRNSFVGLSSGAFGTVKLGNMDTVYKEYGDTFAMFGIASGNFISASNVLSQSISSVRAARFHERRNSSIMYETPTFAGFTGGIMYGPDEGKTNSKNVNLWSYGLKWDSERFYVSVHQEKHEDFFGLSNSISNTALRNGATAANGTFTPAAAAHSKDTGTRASAEFRLPTMRFVFDVSQLKYTESGQTPGAARVAEYKHTTYGIGWDGGFGPWRFATQFLSAGEGECSLTVGGCSTAGLGAKMWTVGARYRLDRQTFVYAIGAVLKNGESANFNNNSTITGLPLGSDPKNVALGISYTF